MLTPAFAVEMEEVAHHAEDYNKESKEKKSFFGKIKFLAKGYKLLKEAEELEKQSEEKNKELQGKKKDNTQESLFETHNKKIIEQNRLLKYQNNKKTVTSLNSNNTTNSSNVNYSVSEAPPECADDANNIIHFLTNMGIQPTLEQHNTIDTSLMNDLIQIIDPKGHIRYAKITNITLEGKNPGITINTGNNEHFYSIPEFQKAYTGINLKLDKNNNTNQILNHITSKQKNDLNQEKNEAKNIHDKSRTQVIIWGILIGIGIILLIIGTILTLFYGTQLIQTAQNAPKYTIEASQEYMAEMNSEKSLKGRPLVTQEKLDSQTLNAINDLKMLGPDALDEFITRNFALGLFISAITLPKLVLYVASQNWIQVILCAVGLILALVGIGLIITGTIKTIMNSIIWYNINVVTNRNKIDSKDLDEWLKHYNALNNTSNSTPTNITTT